MKVVAVQTDDADRPAFALLRDAGRGWACWASPKQWTDDPNGPPHWQPVAGDDVVTELLREFPRVTLAVCHFGAAANLFGPFPPRWADRCVVAARSWRRHEFALGHWRPGRPPTWLAPPLPLAVAVDFREPYDQVAGRLTSAAGGRASAEVSRALAAYREYVRLALGGTPSADFSRFELAAHDAGGRAYGLVTDPGRPSVTLTSVPSRPAPPQQLLQLAALAPEVAALRETTPSLTGGWHWAAAGGGPAALDRLFATVVGRSG